ncbi:MAG: hypothetical protein KDK08_28665 [Rhizobiaceae bacterium]|nr:hypothetical protein [Paracoccaceae bacterium]MCB1471046.1 hypothetical protein [Rhizobiaceae bacterium]
MALIAVLTGDLIGSTKASNEVINQSFATLSETGKSISAWQGAGADCRFTRYRGDGWQVYLEWHWLALRAALVFFSNLRAGGFSASTRISIGIGHANSVGTDDLSDANGDAFEAAGRGLDQMAKYRIFTIVGTTITSLDAVIVELIEDRARRWTIHQAEAMALWLHPDNPTLAEIGKTLGISAQAVNYRLQGAGGVAIRGALRKWEEEKEIGSPDNPPSGPQKAER